MSAFDIAGAVVWTPLAVLFWFAFVVKVKRAIADQWAAFWLGVLASLAAAFCIARLFGAHL
jgi:hypothetical protein